MEHKTAALMLYALQTASCNLRNTEFEAEDVEDVVIDRSTVGATCIGGPQWVEEDFDDEEEEDAERRRRGGRGGRGRRREGAVVGTAVAEGRGSSGFVQKPEERVSDRRGSEASAEGGGGLGGGDGEGGGG